MTQDKRWPYPYRAISRGDFMALGLNQIAYVKAVEIEGEAVFAVHAADGTEIGVLDSREIAFAACAQHELEPLSVH